MNTDQRHLRIAQLDKKIASFLPVRGLPIPGGGWVHSIRTALGMSLKQLGKKLNLTPQGVKDIERREEEGSITLQRLKEVAAALNMQFVYGFVPKEDSLEQMIENQAYKLAKEIVWRTSQAMNLEDQGIDKDALMDAVKKRAQKIKNELPKKLWD